ncbi:MAG: TonB-dependent receptor [Litorilituus sp.]|jgi:TonB-dependent heme/hemoglobin receptor|nr:TonB-dependent receptor [Litorilituus sp.]
MKKNTLYWALMMAIALPAIATEEALPTVKVKAKLSNVDTVVAKEGQRVGSAEGTQQVAAEYIKAQQAATLADALRKTASVQIDEEGGQQGTLVFIRGFTQDQVSVRVEGAPKNFNQVRHGGAGTIWIDPNMYKSVNVIPGVASNVYGNGSLGGVVLLETKDPSDILKADNDFGANIRSGAETNAQSEFVSVDLAGKINQQFALSSTILVRDTEQYKDGNGEQALLGATGTEDNNYLVKAVFEPSNDQRLEASWIGLRKEYTARTTVGSGSYTDPRFNEITDDTYSIQYNFSPEDNQYLDLNARVSVAETERARYDLDEKIPDIWAVSTTYTELENISTFFQSDDIAHQLRFGFDYTMDDVTTAYNTSDGDALKADRTQIGFYMSDTIALGESLQVILSGRYDSFENEVAGAPKTSESAFSPKASLNWLPFEDTDAKGLSFYGVVGKGFRTPSVHEARADSEPSCGRRGCSIRKANTKLKGEISDSWELGFNYNRAGLFSANDQFDVKLGYVSNNAKDYITSVKVGDYDLEIDGETKSIDVVQYINVNKVKIDGFELFVNYTNDYIFTSLSSQNIDGDYASGDNEGKKLPDISPATTNFSIGGYLFDGKSRIGVDVTHRDSRFFEQRGVDRERRSYTIYDLFGSYQVNNNWLVQLRAENIFNDVYTKRAIIQVDNEDVTTWAPGRNIKVSVEYSF